MRGLYFKLETIGLRALRSCVNCHWQSWAYPMKNLGLLSSSRWLSVTQSQEASGREHCRYQLSACKSRASGKKDWENFQRALVTIFMWLYTFLKGIFLFSNVSDTCFFFFLKKRQVVKTSSNLREGKTRSSCPTAGRLAHFSCYKRAEKEVCEPPSDIDVWLISECHVSFFRQPAFTLEGCLSLEGEKPGTWNAWCWWKEFGQ